MAERTYRIRVVGQLTGLSEGVLRAWERRHGVLKPQRTAGGYRVYTQTDVEVLRRLKLLTEEGVSIGEAVKLLPTIRREVKASASERAEPAVPLAGSRPERWLEEIRSASRSYDEKGLERVLDEALMTLPPLSVVSQLLLPALRTLGDDWHAGEVTVAGEHLVSQAIRARLQGLLHAAPRGSRGLVVCACLPEEDHEIGLLSAALRFRHAGHRVSYLGARTPVEALGVLVREVRPQLVALAATATSGARGFRANLEKLRKALPAGTKIVIGGAAAEKHRAICEELGVLPVVGDEDWSRVLS